MSRLMNLRFDEVAACVNSGSRLASMWSTASSNAHGEWGGTVAETLIDT